jgi:hypothetical protein
VLQLFLLSPFFAFLGMAAQYVGLILCSIIAGVICFSDPQSEARRHLRQLGWLMVVVWAIWPVCNVLAWLLPPDQTAIGIIPGFVEMLHIRSTGSGSAEEPGVFQVVKVLMTSMVPTSILASGVVLVACSKICLSQALQKRFGVSFPLQTFMARLGLAVALLGAYLFYQHFTGFDFRESQRELANMRFPNGTYRIQGFSGHPLTVAGASLAIFGWAAFWLSRGGYLLDRRSRLWLVAVVGLEALFVFASGGRTALVMVAAGGFAVILLRLLDLYQGQRNAARLLRAGFVVLVVGFGLGSAVYLSPIYQRFEEFWQGVSSGQLPNRVVFWQVHWQMFLDSPLWGQGTALLTRGVRRLYYDGMGHAAFPEKFNAHNMVLEILASVGVLGSAVLMECLRRGYLALRRLARSGGEAPSIAFKALVFSIVLNGFHGLTQNVFFDSGVMMAYLMLFWAVVWMSLAAPLKPRTSAIAQGGPNAS